MASGVAVLFGDKIRSQTKPFLYLFQLVAAKDPVHDFSLDSGGADEFGRLYITLQFNDKKGKALAESTLEVEPFGGSSATRYGGGFTEVDCGQVEQAKSIAIIQATEVFAHNQVTRLPISTFTPKFYQPLKITVSNN